MSKVSIITRSFFIVLQIGAGDCGVDAEPETFLHAVDTINTTEFETLFLFPQDVVAMLPTRYNDKLSDFYSAMKRLRWSPVRFGHEKASGHPIWRNRLNGKAVYCINPEYIEPVARSRRSGVLDCACSDRTFGVHDKNCSAGNWWRKLKAKALVAPRRAK